MLQEKTTAKNKPSPKAKQTAVTIEKAEPPKKAKITPKKIQPPAKSVPNKQPEKKNPFRPAYVVDDSEEKEEARKEAARRKREEKLLEKDLELVKQKEINDRR